MGVIVVGGFLWRRANRFGAAAALAAAFLVYYGLNFLMTHSSPSEPAKIETDSIGNALAQLQAACSHGELWQFLGTRKLLLVYNWMAAPYGWATLAGFAALILVSLASHAEDPQRIERFFDNMRRTTDAQGLPDSQVKPLAAQHGQDLLLLDLLGWFTAGRWRGFFRRYREDVLGFVLAWGVVGPAGVLGLGIDADRQMSRAFESIAIAGAWGYIGRKLLDAALRNGLASMLLIPVRARRK